MADLMERLRDAARFDPLIIEAVDEIERLRETLAHSDNEVDSLIEERDRLRIECDVALDEIKRLRPEIARLNSEVEMLSDAVIPAYPEEDSDGTVCCQDAYYKWCDQRDEVERLRQRLNQLERRVAFPSESPALDIKP
jgi:predicted nuclease with TOPRIM domain